MILGLKGKKRVIRGTHTCIHKCPPGLGPFRKMGTRATLSSFFISIENHCEDPFRSYRESFLFGHTACEPYQLVQLYIT